MELFVQGTRIYMVRAVVVLSSHQNAVVTVRQVIMTMDALVAGMLNRMRRKVLVEAWAVCWAVVLIKNMTLAYAIINVERVMEELVLFVIKRKFHKNT